VWVLWIGVVPDPLFLMYCYNYFMAGGVAMDCSVEIPFSRWF